jgi:mono/diheme cytochrome c family protein
MSRDLYIPPRMTLRSENAAPRAARRTIGPRIAAALALLLGSIAVAGACGTQGIQLAKEDPNYRGAVLFRDHCSGCHTLSVVGAEGSASSIKDRVRTNGPNFNVRKENVEQVLYAIRNGGFSGAVMPENIVLGDDAKALAQFLAKYSGLQAPKVPTIENAPQ